mmetsp:Transcript_16228/g.61843  ORF Transcript_16228/g.61843 Transcript_16228/m.61843 type:complete len:200 (+) Transcript_16228:1131-1730(+)
MLWVHDEGRRLPARDQGGRRGRERQGARRPRQPEGAVVGHAGAFRGSVSMWGRFRPGRSLRGETATMNMFLVLLDRVSWMRNQAKLATKPARVPCLSLLENCSQGHATLTRTDTDSRTGRFNHQLRILLRSVVVLSLYCGIYPVVLHVDLWRSSLRVGNTPERERYEARRRSSRVQNGWRRPTRHNVRQAWVGSRPLGL